MTDEQINQRIAEACGWSPDCDSGICWDQHGAAIITFPNYCTDLNAMHEAEQIIVDTDLFFDYCLHTGPLLRATARQRAEAFLRTLGKWEQSGDATEMVEEVHK